MSTRRSQKQPANPVRGYLQYSQPPGPRILSTGTSRNNHHLTGEGRFTNPASDLSGVRIDPEGWRAKVPAKGLSFGEKSEAGRKGPGRKAKP